MTVRHFGLRFLAAAALVAGMAIPTLAHDPGGTDPNLIHACVNTQYGSVRIVGPSGLCTPRAEEPVHWPATPGPTSLDELDGLPCTPPGGAPGSGTSHLLNQGALMTLACAIGQSASGRYLDLGTTVYDTQTRMQWEKKVAGGADPHGVDQTVSWCEATGRPGDPACAATENSWIARLNAQGFAGFGDWRIPTLDELRSIVDQSGRQPAIDPVFGPISAGLSYWSATEVNATTAFSLLFVCQPFGCGPNGESSKAVANSVRAVRGGP